jgi:hypothetical protein
VRIKESREAGEKMKKTTSILSGLFLSSTLLSGGGATLNADDLVVKTPLEVFGYCHMKFPPMFEEILSWTQPVFDGSAGNIIDFHDPCDHETGGEERRTQRDHGFHRTYAGSD